MEYIVACLLPSRVDLPSGPRFTAGEELSLVTHLVFYRGSWKHRLKQNFIFSLVHWKRSLTHHGNTSQAQWYRFFSTRCEDWNAMVDSSQETFQGSQLPILHNGCSYGFSLIPLTGKQYKMKEHREKSPIPFFLQTSLSLSYLLHNSMLKEL